MDTKKIKQGSAKLIAHRGLSGLERENSAAAFVAAGNRPYWGIETDLHRCADGVFVIIHDSMTGRVAHMDLCVEESTYAQLQQVRLKNLSEGEAPREDLRIPTLDDYMDICHKYGKVAVLELKTVFDPSTMLEMVECIRRHGHLEQTVFISFHWENMVLLRDLLPDQPLQYLTQHPVTEELQQELIDRRIELDIYHKSVTRENVEALHAAGRAVNCWTVDDPEIAEKLLDWGVDYITTNILEYEVNGQ